MSTFEKLERLNAQIDIWIDEEDYKSVYEALPITKNAGLEKNVKDFFRLDCTQSREPQWQIILSRKIPLPIEQAKFEGGDVPLDTNWSRLFYTKLLRAHIQDKGTDCYLGRLDEVEAYLESHFFSIMDDKDARLAVICLIELAAVSQSFETLGFAERAGRFMDSHERALGEHPKEFIWFYSLFKSYNIGVGHFHKGRYRKAIFEFNQIIEQVRKEKTNPSSKLAFFQNRSGYLLLYFPAVIFRSDVQLRLQLAYHALDTLDRYFEPTNELSDYKKVRKHLISTEAYQQMGRLDNTESWKHLSEAYSLLWKLELTNNSRKQSFKHESHELKERISFTPLPFSPFFKGQRKNLKGQFLHFYIEDHLEWLDKFSQSTESQYQKQCSKIVGGMFAEEYFELVRLKSRERNGYFIQLAKFIAWLSKQSKQPTLLDMAKKLYEHSGKRMLESTQGECRLCTNIGIDWKKMILQLSWFQDYMLKYFHNLLDRGGSHQDVESEQRKFIDKFIEQERKMIDRRIAQLDLRYELKGEREDLQKGYTCYESGSDSPKLFPAFNRLLDGSSFEKESERMRDFKLLHSKEYKSIMEQWDKDVARYLRSTSNQNGHKKGLYLIGLQRWNSSSPAQGRSIGGGYLLYHTDERGTVDLGIAIDPGFDFVRNLFHEGFSINDIDIILISHSHVDHIRDFESIIQLLADLWKETKREKCVHVMLSLGAYERLKHIIEDPFYRYRVEPYIIDVRREIEPEYFEHLSKSLVSFFKRNCNDGDRHEMRYWADLRGEKSVLTAVEPEIRVEVEPTAAYHPDPSNYSDSFGFKIKVTELDKQNSGCALKLSAHTTSIGYTGDTKWVFPSVCDFSESKDNGHPIVDVSKQYVDCDVVIVHLGSVITKDKVSHLRNELMNCKTCDALQQVKCREIVCDENHPYLVGLIRILSSLYPKRKERKETENKLDQLILVSEFGEELRGGIRSDLIERLKHAYKGALKFLPLDVGTDLQLFHWEKGKDGESVANNEQNVWCIQCERFITVDDAEFERYGIDEALFCLCHTCRKATPLNVIQDRMRQLYDVGRDLRTLDE